MLTRKWPGGMDRALKTNKISTAVPNQERTLGEHGKITGINKGKSCKKYNLYVLKLFVAALMVIYNIQDRGDNIYNV